MQVIRHGFLGLKKKKHLPLLNSEHKGTFTILFFILDQDFCPECSFIPLFELVHKNTIVFPTGFILKEAFMPPIQILCTSVVP